MTDDGALEEDFDAPPVQSIEEIKASLERGHQDVVAGRTVEGQVVLDELRARIDAMKAARRIDHGQADR